MIGIAVVLLSAGSWWYWSYRTRAKAIDQLNQGITLYRNSRFSAATNLFLTAVRDDAKLVRGWLYLGASYAQQCPQRLDPPAAPDPEMCVRAKDAFERALRIDPDNSLALAGIGSMYAEMEDFEKAKDQFRRLVKVDPSNPAPYVWIGLMDWAICDKRTDELVTRLYGSLDRRSTTVPERARMELEKQNGPLVEEGMKVLSRALEIKPNDVTAMYYLSRLYRQKAELERDDGARSQQVEKANHLIDLAIAARKTTAEAMTAKVDKDFEFVLPATPPPPPPAPKTTIIAVRVRPDHTSETKPSCSPTFPETGDILGRRVLYFDPDDSIAGAEVYLDGKCQGDLGISGRLRDNMLVNVPPGSYEIALKKKGFQEYRSTISVPSSNTLPNFTPKVILRIRLAPPGPYIAVRVGPDHPSDTKPSCSPTFPETGDILGRRVLYFDPDDSIAGAEVYLDGKCQGDLGISGRLRDNMLVNVPPGSYEIALKKKGFQEYRSTIGVPSSNTLPNATPKVILRIRLAPSGS
jgi:tetratricopeptide (TPR) repeat protein